MDLGFEEFTISDPNKTEKINKKVLSKELPKLPENNNEMQGPT